MNALKVEYVPGRHPNAVKTWLATCTVDGGPFVAWGRNPDEALTRLHAVACELRQKLAADHIAEAVRTFDLVIFDSPVDRPKIADDPEPAPSFLERVQATIFGPRDEEIPW